MFEVSIFLLIKYIIINLIIPIISWILFLWIFFWTKFKWIIFYIISFFIWTWVIAFGLFNLQFFYFWIWILEYLFLNLLLIIILIWKIVIKKQRIIDYIENLKLTFNITELKKSYKNLNLVNKVFFIIWSIFISLFSLIWLLFTANFPTYSDDSFWNWHSPAINIYYDWWIKIFWDENEILWRWRLGYPIYISIYKALISDFNWVFNDIYINLWQFLWFILFLFFIFHITFKKTNNLFYSIIPLALICWLPLTFFHISEWYLDLTSALYSVFMIYFLYEFLENNGFDDLNLWILFWFILANIKNDWLVVYFAWTIIAFIIYLILSKKLVYIIKLFFKDKWSLFKIWFFTFYFFLPFIFLKSYLWLWYNQAAWENSWVWLSFHPEIFWVSPHIFLNQDNYNVILIFLVIIWIILYNRGKSYLFIWLSFLMIFIILIAVFLFTENYLWVMNQTTVNRVFTMTFIILFSFIWILLNEKTN